MANPCVCLGRGGCDTPFSKGENLLGQELVISLSEMDNLFVCLIGGGEGRENDDASFKEVRGRVYNFGVQTVGFVVGENSNTHLSKEANLGGGGEPDRLVSCFCIVVLVYCFFTQMRHFV